MAWARLQFSQQIASLRRRTLGIVEVATGSRQPPGPRCWARFRRQFGWYCHPRLRLSGGGDGRGSRRYLADRVFSRVAAVQGSATSSRPDEALLWLEQQLAELV